MGLLNAFKLMNRSKIIHSVYSRGLYVIPVFDYRYINVYIVLSITFKVYKHALYSSINILFYHI